MNEFANALFKFMLVLSPILGILLLTIAGFLIFSPGLLLKILKYVFIALCGIGGVALLLVAINLGIYVMRISRWGNK